MSRWQSMRTRVCGACRVCFTRAWQKRQSDYASAESLGHAHIPPACTGVERLSPGLLVTCGRGLR